MQEIVRNIKSRNDGENLVMICSINYHRPATKMVSADELSIVNTSVRASVRSQSLLLPDAKAAEKGVWKREMKKKGEISTPCIPTCYAHICTYAARLITRLRVGSWSVGSAALKCVSYLAIRRTESSCGFAPVNRYLCHAKRISERYYMIL